MPNVTWGFRPFSVLAGPGCIGAYNYYRMISNILNNNKKVISLHIDDHYGIPTPPPKKNCRVEMHGRAVLNFYPFIQVPPIKMKCWSWFILLYRLHNSGKRKEQILILLIKDISIISFIISIIFTFFPNHVKFCLFKYIFFITNKGQIMN